MPCHYAVPVEAEKADGRTWRADSDGMAISSGGDHVIVEAFFSAAHGHRKNGLISVCSGRRSSSAVFRVLRVHVHDRADKPRDVRELPRGVSFSSR